MHSVAIIRCTGRSRARSLKKHISFILERHIDFAFFGCNAMLEVKRGGGICLILPYEVRV